MAAYSRRNRYRRNVGVKLGGRDPVLVERYNRVWDELPDDASIEGTPLETAPLEGEAFDADVDFDLEPTLDFRKHPIPSHKLSEADQALQNLVKKKQSGEVCTHKNWIKGRGLQRPPKRLKKNQKALDEDRLKITKITPQLLRAGDPLASIDCAQRKRFTQSNDYISAQAYIDAVTINNVPTALDEFDAELRQSTNFKSPLYKWWESNAAVLVYDMGERYFLRLFLHVVSGGNNENNPTITYANHEYIYLL